VVTRAGVTATVVREASEGFAMAEKSPRRLKLEASLAQDPADPFLRYGLAMQCLRDGDVAEGRQRLLALIADHPDDQVAAYQQLGQSYLDEGQTEQARAILTTGIAKARARGDWHAAAEMEGLLS
jgi:predicted Zn-dependent protease